MEENLFQLYSPNKDKKFSWCQNNLTTRQGPTQPKLTWPNLTWPNLTQSDPTWPDLTWPDLTWLPNQTKNSNFVKPPVTRSLQVTLSMWHEALQTLGPIHLKLYIHKIIYFPKPVSHIKHVTQSPQTVYQIYLKLYVY